MTGSAQSILNDLNDRSREIFRRVVNEYLETGDPVGSRTVSRAMNGSLSAATIRNVMQDLEIMGLLDSPHVSAGRVPTQQGLRLFVDALLEVTEIDEADRIALASQVADADPDIETLLDRTGQALSGLTHGASLVLAPKTEAPIRHIEFVPLAADRALAVLVTADGHVENRIFTPPAGMTPSAMRQAANFINTVAEGRTLAELRGAMAQEIRRNRRELDQLAQELVNAGLALWEDKGQPWERLIVRGRANLLEDMALAEDLERAKELFDELERKRDIAQFLEMADDGEGVRIFIGSENRLFSLSGSSLVVSPYMNADRKIVGAIGVIGPTRLNYGRIVPIVDYAARLVGQAMAGKRERD